MRYDTPVFFQKITHGEYNTGTGDYDADIIDETKVYADVTNSGADTLNLVYGEIKEGSLTVRIQRQYNEAFNRIRIGDKQYRVDFSRQLRNVETFVVSEV